MQPIPEEKLSKRKPPNDAIARRGMTVKGLLRNTPKYVKNTSAEELIIKSMEKVWTKGGMRAVRAVVVNAVKKPKSVHTYKCTVVGLDAKASTITGVKQSQVPKLHLQKRVLVDCSCEFFMYFCEYALWTHGAARIKRCNGQPAVVRNPMNAPLVCKHLVAVLQTIQDHSF